MNEERNGNGRRVLGESGRTAKRTATRARHCFIYLPLCQGLSESRAQWSVPGDELSFGNRHCSPNASRRTRAYRSRAVARVPLQRCGATVVIVSLCHLTKKVPEWPSQTIKDAPQIINETSECRSLLRLEESQLISNDHEQERTSVL